jgi:hypothetical protein
MCLCVYQTKPVGLRAADVACPFVRPQLKFCAFFGLISFFNDCAMAKAVISGLSPRAAEFDTRIVNVVFVVDRVALGQVFLPVLRFFPVTIISPFLHTHLYLHVAVIRRTNGRSWEPSNSNITSEIAGHKTEVASDISMFSSAK